MTQAPDSDDDGADPVSVVEREDLPRLSHVRRELTSPVEQDAAPVEQKKAPGVAQLHGNRATSTSASLSELDRAQYVCRRGRF